MELTLRSRLHVKELQLLQNGCHDFIVCWWWRWWWICKQSNSLNLGLANTAARDKISGCCFSLILWSSKKGVTLLQMLCEDPCMLWASLSLQKLQHTSCNPVHLCLMRSWQHNSKKGLQTQQVYLPHCSNSDLQESDWQVQPIQTWKSVAITSIRTEKDDFCKPCRLTPAEKAITPRWLLIAALLSDTAKLGQILA